MGLRSAILELARVYEALDSGVYRPGSREWLVESVIDPQPNTKVLDVGCGTAGILSLLPDVCYLGIDHNPRYIEKARSVHGSRGRFEVLDVNDPSFKSLGTFDRILVLGVLHHLNDAECAVLIQSLSASLSPNGRLITFDNTLAEGQHPIARMMSRLDRGRYSRSPAGYRRIIESHFEIQTEIVRHDLMRIPYSHATYCARARWGVDARSI